MLRSLARHPAYLPLVGVLAVLVTALVLQAVRVNEQASSARAAATAATAPAAAVSVTADVLRVQLARDGAGSDRILVRPAGQRSGVWIAVTPATRILAPVEDRYALGGALDLARGQQVRIDIDSPLGISEGAAAERITIQGAGDQPAFD